MKVKRYQIWLNLIRNLKKYTANAKNKTGSKTLSADNFFEHFSKSFGDDESQETRKLNSEFQFQSGITYNNLKWAFHIKTLLGQLGFSNIWLNQDCLAGIPMSTIN